MAAYNLEMIEYLKYRVTSPGIGEIGTIRMDAGLFFYENDEVNGFTPVIGEAAKVLLISKTKERSIHGEQ